MPNPLASAILITWKRNAAYGLRLVEDVAPAAWVAQPLPTVTLNHPAWILSHLNLYADLAVRMARAERLDDPGEHRYGQKSEPQRSMAAYESKDALIAAWTRVHADGEAALLAATPEIISAPTPIERWRTLHPTVGDMLMTLMVKHESAHLGQLSAWRRAMNMPRVAM
jgi:hypothetical protein